MIAKEGIQHRHGLCRVVGRGAREESTMKQERVLPLVQLCKESFFHWEKESGFEVRGSVGKMAELGDGVVSEPLAASSPKRCPRRTLCLHYQCLTQVCFLAFHPVHHQEPSLSTEPSQVCPHNNKN